MYDGAPASFQLLGRRLDEEKLMSLAAIIVDALEDYKKQENWENVWWQTQDRVQQCLGNYAEYPRPATTRLKLGVVHYSAYWNQVQVYESL